jgi:hypothetical protein
MPPQHSPGAHGCVCRRCTPPFTFFAEDIFCTPLDLLVKLEELGVDVVTDGRVVFLISNPSSIPALIMQYSEKIRKLVHVHRVWLRKYLRHTPVQLLRTVLGEDVYEEALRKVEEDPELEPTTQHENPSDSD